MDPWRHQISGILSQLTVVHCHLIINIPDAFIGLMMCTVPRRHFRHGITLKSAQEEHMCDVYYSRTKLHLGNTCSIYRISYFFIAALSGSLHLEETALYEYLLLRRRCSIE